MRKLTFIAVLCLAASAVSAQPPSFSCPRTVGSTPDGGASAIWGGDSFSVVLPADGVWHGMGPDHGFRDKLAWLSHDFRPGQESNLTVAGRRLDQEERPAAVSRPSTAGSFDEDAGVMLVLVEFPSAGCWQITGRYLGQELAFVVEVRAPNEEDDGDGVYRIEFSVSQ